MATQFKYEGVDPIIISETLGHSHDGMTLGRYASRYPLETLKEVIDQTTLLIALKKARRSSFSKVLLDRI